jgi:acetylornithine deacetylase
MNELHAARVFRQVDLLSDEIVALAQTLIRFDSVNQPPGGNEGPCQAFIAARLRSLGLAVDTFTPDEVPGITADPAYLAGRDYTGRPNVVGVWPGLGGGRSLHLAAHADVVPIGDPARWTVDPFGAEIRDGKIYGRGAVDDKDGLTGMLGALTAIQRAGIRLRGDLILSSYVDEEFAGGNGLLAIVRKGYCGDAAVNCDGVAFEFWVANTGGGPFRIIFQSRVEASHPTPGVLRVQGACRAALAELSRQWRARYWQHPLYPSDTPWLFRREPILLDDWPAALAGWNWIEHGPAVGLRGYATTLPGQERVAAKVELEAAIAQAYAAADAPDVYPPRVEWIYRFMDACEVPAASPIVAVATGAYQAVSGQKAVVSGGPRSDLYILPVHGGVPAVSVGVGDVLHGPGCAHEPDERIDIQAELLPYVKTVALTILEWCGAE